MKLTVSLKLQPAPAQAKALRDTLQAVNAACDSISQTAWEAREFAQFRLHRLVYKPVKDAFNLSAQVVVRAISKVADAYKSDKKVKRTFRADGAIAYDDRILRYYTDNGAAQVSIWTMQGRQVIPFVCGEHQRKLLASRKGESDLTYRNGAFYLQATCDIPEIEAAAVADFVGVDLGVVNIATTSENETFSGAEVEQTRAKYANLRQTLQHKASRQSKSRKRPRSIRKFQKRISKKEKNFRKHTNHCISKKLVATAKTLGKGLAFENLEGIKTNLKQRFQKGQRAKISGWSFQELRQFTEYKARLAGVPLVLVDARYTSQTCSACGHCAKANRRSQAEFVCVSCHHSENADFNAARNIRRRATSNLAQESKSAALKKAA